MKNESLSESYCVLTDSVTGEYEEKKSRFIAYLAPVYSEEEALSFIASIKKKHYDARHNCSAFIIGDDKSLIRSSDDGEPSGTAGKPMLEVLNGANVTNVVAVVTRYFGGVLLGTGGLVRAYTEAMKAAVDNATLATITFCTDIDIKVSYTDVNNIQYYLSNNSIMVLNTDYADNVVFSIRVENTDEEMIVNAFSEMTKGKAIIDIKERGWKLNTH